jgi:hypothetical protein
MKTRGAIVRLPYLIKEAAAASLYPWLIQPESAVSPPVKIENPSLADGKAQSKAAMFAGANINALIGENPN